MDGHPYSSPPHWFGGGPSRGRLGIWYVWNAWSPGVERTLAPRFGTMRSGVGGRYGEAYDVEFVSYTETIVSAWRYIGDAKVIIDEAANAMVNGAETERALMAVSIIHDLKPNT